VLGLGRMSSLMTRTMSRLTEACRVSNMEHMRTRGLCRQACNVLVRHYERLCCKLPDQAHATLCVKLLVRDNGRCRIGCARVVGRIRALMTLSMSRLMDA
jgi:hypothetical protein